MLPNSAKLVASSLKAIIVWISNLSNPICENCTISVRLSRLVPYDAKIGSLSVLSHLILNH